MKYVLSNLKAEIARGDLKTKDLAQHLSISVRTINYKLSGETEFTLSEMMKLKEIFPDNSLEYLFAMN